jgi:hypothetical protein
LVLRRRKRKPRDIAADIIGDRLEAIEKRAKKGLPLTEEETNFAVAAYKTLTDAEAADAQAEYLQHLTPAQSNRLDEIIEAIELEERKPLEAPGTNSPAIGS